eukprot:m.336769 g.336769  ORF g.336769 m.336769 type:complete len:290 (-) comp17955_c0_seq1:124-993(-)
MTAIRDVTMQAERKRKMPKQFVCKVCNRQFGQSGDLKRHERVHTGEKPYQCEFCPKAFAQKGNLKVHEEIHRKEQTSKETTRNTASRHSCRACELKDKEIAALRHQNSQLRFHMQSLLASYSSSIKLEDLPANSPDLCLSLTIPRPPQTIPPQTIPRPTESSISMRTSTESMRTSTESTSHLPPPGRVSSLEEIMRSLGAVTDQKFDIKEFASECAPIDFHTPSDTLAGFDIAKDFDSEHAAVPDLAFESFPPFNTDHTLPVSPDAAPFDLDIEMNDAEMQMQTASFGL